MPKDEAGPLASPSLARHLGRGAVGFGLIVVALALCAVLSPLALMLVVPGMVALRGCPMCWTAGLVETVSAGRAVRRCGAEDCSTRAISGSLRSRQGAEQDLRGPGAEVAVVALAEAVDGR
jgi:hypothetical protein